MHDFVDYNSLRDMLVVYIILIFLGIVKDIIGKVVLDKEITFKLKSIGNLSLPYSVLIHRFCS